MRTKQRGVPPPVLPRDRQQRPNRAVSWDWMEQEKHSLCSVILPDGARFLDPSLGFSS
jgi:hypothetical protein